MTKMKVKRSNYDRTNQKIFEKYTFACIQRQSKELGNLHLSKHLDLTSRFQMKHPKKIQDRAQ